MATSELRFDLQAIDRASATFVALAATVEKLERKLASLDRQEAAPEVTVKTDKADRDIGNFAAGMKRRLDAAVKSLPDIELDADSSDADRKVAFLREQLAELRDARIGVDIDAADADARLRLLQGELAEFAEGSSDIRVRADATEAVAALGRVKDEVQQADRAAGQFADTLQTRVAAAVEALPDIEITADSSDADREIAQIRADLETLSDKRIGVDLDAAAAVAEARRLQEQLERLGASSPNVQVQADTLAAAAKLEEIQRQADRLDGRSVKLDLNAIEGPVDAALSKMTLLGQVMGGLALGGGILSAGPQLASLAASAVAAAGALGVIPALLGAAGGGFAAIKVGLSGVSDAFTALGASDDAGASKSSSNASQRVAAANRVRSAQESLAQAQQQADRQAITSAEQVARAQEGVADARRSAQQQAVESARAVAQAEESLAEAREQADERAVDGARQLAQARQSVADAVANAADREQSAEESLERAQRSATDAQQDLNRAREDAKQKIEDLSLTLSGAALDEESAQIRLARAQERLSQLKPNASALDQQEAVLGVRQAEQALTEVQHRYQQVQEESTKAAQAGVEGSEQVVAAQERLDDANRSVADGQKALTKAQTDGARSVADAQDRLAQAQLQVSRQATESARSVAEAQDRVTQAQEAQRRSAEDSSRSIARAEQGLADARRQAAWSAADSADRVAKAQRDVAEAVKSGADAGSAGAAKVDKYAEALKKLSPNAREFMGVIRELKPRWDELTRAVQNNLFAGVADQTKTLAGIYLPKLQDLLGGIASAANRGALQVAGFLGQSDTAAALQTAFDRIGVALDIAAGAAKPLTELLTNLFTTGAQFLPGLAQDFKDLADRAAAFVQRATDSGDLTRWIGNGIETLKQFGRLFVNVGDIIFTVLSAAQGHGASFLSTLVELTGKVRAFLHSPEGNDLLTKVFDSVKQTIDNLRPGLSAVWDAITGAIREIAPKIPGVAESFSRLAEKLAPVLSTITVTVFKALASAFDVLSRLPTPVLVALGAALLAMAGLVKAGGAIKSTVELFDALAKAQGHVSTIADKLRDIFGQTNGKRGALKAALLGDDGCTSTRACLDEVNDKLKTNNDELDKTKKKGGLKGSLDPGSVEDDVPDGEPKSGRHRKGASRGGRLKKVAKGAGIAAAAAGAGLALSSLSDEDDPNADPTKGGAGSLASDVGDTAGRILSFDVGGVVDKIIRDVKLFPQQWDDATKTISKSWDELWTSVETAWNGFTGWLSGEWTSFTTSWDGFWAGIGDSVSATWLSLTTGASTGWTNFTTWLSGEWTAFTTAWDGFWSGIGSTVSTTWTNLVTWVQTKWSEITTWLSVQWTTYSTMWTAFWAEVGTTVSQAWDAIKTWVSTKWNELSADAQNRWNEYRTTWNQFWDLVGQKLQDAWNNIKTWASTKWNELWEEARNRWNEYKTTWNQLWDLVGQKLSDAWENIKRIASGAWNYLRDTVWNPLIDFVKVAIPDAFDTASTAIGKAWDKIKALTADPARFVINTVYNDGIRPMWNSVAGLVNLGQLPDRRAAFATGGPVFGAGTATSDSIPALLSNGEHVWTAREVQAAGGHDRIMALRSAALRGFLPGFASGGGVGGFSGSGSATSSTDRATGSVQGVNALPSLSALSGAYDRVKNLIAGWGGSSSTWASGMTGMLTKLGQGAYDFLKGKVESFLSSIVSTVGGGAAPAGSGAIVDQVRQAANAVGWGTGPEWDALSWVISHESGWNPNAQNPTSTAYGLFQFLNSTWGTVGGSKTSNPYQQAVYGLRYIKSRYGDPIGAQRFWAAHHYYDRGGVLSPGATLAMNATGRPERVLSAEQTASFDRLVRHLDAHGSRVYGDGAALGSTAVIAAIDRLGDRLGKVEQGLTYAPTINNPVAETASATAASDLRTAILLRSLR